MTQHCRPTNWFTFVIIKKSHSAQPGGDLGSQYSIVVVVVVSRSTSSATFVCVYVIQRFSNKFVFLRRTHYMIYDCLLPPLLPPQVP